jgi:hypothetical protein
VVHILLVDLLVHLPRAEHRVCTIFSGSLLPYSRLKTSQDEVKSVRVLVRVYVYACVCVCVCV